MQAGKGPGGTVAAPVFQSERQYFLSLQQYFLLAVSFFTDIRLAFVTVFQFLHAQPVRCLGLA